MILNYYAIVNNRPPAPRSEDGSTGGGWGEECRSVRAWKPRRTAQKLLGRNRAEISLSFFEFFSGGARKRKIVRENFCEVAAGALAEAGGGTVSSVQKMFEQSCIKTPKPYFSVFRKPFRGRLAEPPIDFALMNPCRSARRRAPRGWPKRGSTPLYS